ncbi:hypothetical protein [Streptomyces sp. NPDC046862]|uniref:hypothetical protein n=1 Tax=Streptomyces sp. NPDC046862 TaxID=3154603 RepID=UPI0034523088
MPALSARHIASSALCAALLVGVTGPAAMAVDTARERSHAASADARLPRADAILKKLRKVNGGELTPVADLLLAVLEADDGRLPADEARKLGAAAKRALAKASVRTSTTSGPATSDPATDLMSPASSGAAVGLADDDDLDDLLDGLFEGVAEDLLEDVGEAVDRLLEAITHSVRDVLPEVDDLMSVLEDLTDALADEGLMETTSSDVKVSSTQTQTSTVTRPDSDSAVGLPLLTPLTQVLLSIL